MTLPHYKIGFITLESSMSYTTQLWLGANDCATQLGISLITFGINEQAAKLATDSEKFYEYLAQLIDTNALDGLLIWTAGLLKDHALAPQFLAHYTEIPMLSLGLDTPGVHRLLVDNYGGMFQLVSHLIESCGRRNLAFLTGQLSNEDAKIRLKAYKDALHHYDLPVKEEHIIIGEFNWDSTVTGKQAVREFLDIRKLTLDAIVASSDHLAIGVLQELQQRAIVVPKEISVTGFDGIPECNITQPPLTTVAQSPYDLAWRGLELLYDRIQGKTTPECIMLPTQVVVRVSCGAALKTTAPTTYDIETAIEPVALQSNALESLETLLQQSSDTFQQIVETEFASACIDHGSEPNLNIIKEIPESFVQTLLAERPDYFLHTVQQILYTVKEEGELVGCRRSTMALLTYFRQDMLTLHLRPATLRHATLSRFCLQLEKDLHLIFEQAEHVFMRYQSVEKEYQFNRLHMISHSLLVAHDPQQIDEIFARHLPDLGIELAYVAVRESLETSPERLRLIVAYNRHGQSGQLKVGHYYKATELTSGNLVLQDQAMRLLVVPLYSNHLYAGFVLFGVGPHSYPLYVQLADALGNSFVNKLLLEEVHHHVDQLKKNEQILRKSEQRLRVILEAIPDAVYRVNRHGFYTAYKPATNEEHRFHDDALIGKPLAEVLPADIAKLMQGEIQIALTKGEQRLFEMTLPDAMTSAIHYYEARLLPSGTDEVQIIVRDITAAKQQEQSALQAQKLESLGLLAGGIAHDFNNLLTSVLGQASLAAVKLARNLSPMDHIQKVIVAAERAAELTHQLLAYAGQGEIHISLLDINQVVNDIIKIMAMALPVHVNLDIALKEDLPPILVDRVQIQQVIMNLFLNATEALPEDRGSISISTTTQYVDDNAIASVQVMGNKIARTALAPGPYVVVKITDSGVGMSQVTQSRIFDPFFSTKPKGHGLGLSATNGIIQRHHGGLTVESQLGVGTTFKIFLPAHLKAQATREDEVELVALNHEARQKCVLVIDDETYVREAANDILEEQGFQVKMAANGYEGISIFRTDFQSIDVVLLDLKMPEISGQETYQQLRNIQPDLKVIFTSGYSESEISSLTSESDHTTFLSKPYTLELLTKRIYQMLSHDS